MQLRGSTVLVTGATGFVGARLAERLIFEEGARVRVLARDPAKAAALSALGADVRVGDLTKPDTLRPAVEGCRFVFHAAAATSAEYGDADAFRKTNVDGTRALAAAAREAGVERFVHVSSVSVYGARPPRACDERTPFATSGSVYCETKIGAELAVKDEASRGLRAVVVRPANVYGPNSTVWTVRQVERILAGRMFLVDGGRGLCNPLYLDNLVDALLLAATVDGVEGEDFVVSDGDAVPWSDFFGRYARMCGREPLRTLSLPAALAFGAALKLRSRLNGVEPSISIEAIRSLAQRTTYDSTKARRMLGFSPRVDLDEGMKRSERWLREQGILPR